MSVAHLLPDLWGAVVGSISVAALVGLWKYAPYLEDGNIDKR